MTDVFLNAAILVFVLGSALLAISTGLQGRRLGLSLFPPANEYAHKDFRVGLANSVGVATEQPQTSAKIDQASLDEIRALRAEIERLRALSEKASTERARVRMALQTIIDAGTADYKNSQFGLAIRHYSHLRGAQRSMPKTFVDTTFKQLTRDPVSSDTAEENRSVEHWHVGAKDAILTAKHGFEPELRLGVG